MILRKIQYTKIFRVLMFRLNYLILGVFIIMSSIIPSYAKDALKTESRTNETSITTNVIKKVFTNGLTVLVKPNYDREIVAVNLFARMGPLYESPEQKGISAFMQRILFKGGTDTRNLTQINNELEALGASRNSVSFSDYGYVSLMATKSNLDKALDIYLDVIRNPLFLEWEVENNKKEVMQEFKVFEDQPFNVASLVFNNSFYGDHPYNGLIGGNIETISALRRKDILEWYRKIYIPSNMVITVVGDVDSTEVIKRFQNTFGKLPKGKLPKISTMPIPKLEKEVVTYQPKNIQGAFMILGYPAPSQLSNDAPAMDILNTILGGGGMGNRLFTELRDKRGLAYYVGSSYQPMVGPTAIIAAMVTAPENYRMAHEGIVAEFKRFCDEPISIEELQAAKKYLKGTFIMSQETSAAQGMLLGLFELLGYGYKYINQYPELIDKVTEKDIQRVAQKYFNHYVLAVVAPEGSIEE
jgi:zinc protease